MPTTHMHAPAPQLKLPPPAPTPRQSILVAGKPHLGTDRLVRMLKLFREHLIAWGAEVRFGATVDDLLMQGGRLVGVRLAGEPLGLAGTTRR